MLKGYAVNQRRLEYLEKTIKLIDIANRIDEELENNDARKNNLYISGGSDYHGRKKPDIEVGIGKGNLHISKEIIEEWVNH